MFETDGTEDDYSKEKYSHSSSNHTTFVNALQHLRVS